MHDLDADGIHDLHACEIHDLDAEPGVATSEPFRIEGLAEPSPPVFAAGALATFFEA